MNINPLKIDQITAAANDADGLRLPKAHATAAAQADALERNVEALPVLEKLLRETVSAKTPSPAANDNFAEEIALTG